MGGGRLVLIVAVLAVLAVAVFLGLALGTGTVVEVDDDGFFASAEHAASGDVFAGAGVMFAAADPASGRVFGRLAPRAERPMIWVRTAPRELNPLTLRATKSSASWRQPVRAAALAALAATGASDTTSAFAECCGGPVASPAAPPTDGAVPYTSRSPVPAPAPREPLEAWAPEECIFVRFRSVEAAYRFASAFDALAAALLAAQADDARDYGSLRLTLHDLVLPTIWRTNPDATRGVGEVGLVVAPPFVRGRLTAAVLLRITDPELHRMQTEAGIAQQSAPDHLWRPPDDPFPAERDPINFRAIPDGAPDIEVVATSRTLGERIVSRRSAAVAGTAAYREAREATAGPDGSASADEAAFLFSGFAGDPLQRGLVPGVLRSAGREMREGGGLRWLAERWLGGARASSALDLRSHAPSALAGVEAVRVTTDPAGAAVWARCAGAEEASQFASALRSLPAGGAGADRACARNLADLVPLALADPHHDDLAERAFVVLGWKPVCPCGGTYALHPVTREVSCTAHGTAASPRPAPFTPPAVSQVKLEGAELSFRLAIDWNRKE